MSIGVTAGQLGEGRSSGGLRDVRGKALTAEQMEIARLKAELSRVRMERDILKNCPGLGPPVRGRNGLWYGGGGRVAADSLLVA